MYHRDYLKRQYIRLSSQRVKNRLNKLINDTKENYFKAKLSNANNSKESWQALTELLNKKPKATQVKQLIVDNQTITDDKKIADCFNEYFYYWE